MQLSVVVVTHNSEHCIEGCLTATRRVPGGCEIILVDNLSEDGTLERAQAVAPDARIIRMGSNAGYARACNAGVHAATYEHVMCMNPDVELCQVAPESLESLTTEDRFGLVVPGLAYGEGVAPRPELFAGSSWLRELATVAFQAFRPRELVRRTRLATNAEASWACGALVIVRKSEFFAVGGFDERFFLYYEDQTLGASYRRAHLPIRGTAAIWGRHATGTSSYVDLNARIDPMAWCMLGWLEFVAMNHGRRRAKLSWAAVRRVHVIGRQLAKGGGTIFGSQRLFRKAAQLTALECAVTALATAGIRHQHPFCQVACEVVCSK